jgi:hypothetical protein
LFTVTGEQAMNKPRVVLLAAVLSSAILVIPSFAHHAIGAVFDTSKTSFLKGTITNVNWRNPHASIALDVRDATTGKVTNWFIETAGVDNLAKAGLDRSMIDLNQTYSVEVYLAKEGRPQAVGINLIFPDSRSFDIGEKPNAPVTAPVMAPPVAPAK